MQAQEGARPLYSNGEAISAINRREPFANKTGSFIGWRLEFQGAPHAPGTRLYPLGEVITIDLLDRDGDMIGRLDIGALPDVYAEELCKSLEFGSTVYVVYSYGTVIGWTHCDQVIIPNVRYSATTSRHQHVLEETMGAQWLQLDGAPAHVPVEDRARSYTPKR